MNFMNWSWKMSSKFVLPFIFFIWNEFLCAVFPLYISWTFGIRCKNVYGNKQFSVEISDQPWQKTGKRRKTKPTNNDDDNNRIMQSSLLDIATADMKEPHMQKKNKKQKKIVDNIITNRRSIYTMILSDNHIIESSWCHKMPCCAKIVNWVVGLVRLSLSVCVYEWHTDYSNGRMHRVP